VYKQANTELKAVIWFASVSRCVNVLDLHLTVCGILL